MMILKLVPTKAFKTYHLYSVVNSKGEVIYVSIGKIHEITSFKQLQRFESFDPTQEYTIRIEGSYPTRHAALNWQFAKMKELPAVPLFNTYMHTAETIKGIVCNETGITYRCASDACLALDIPPARMSNHLRRIPGHKSINGMTYSYCKLREV